jgi:hypothetical protein
MPTNREIPPNTETAKLLNMIPNTMRLIPANIGEVFSTVFLLLLGIPREKNQPLCEKWGLGSPSTLPANQGCPLHFFSHYPRHFSRTYLKNKIRVQGKARSGEKAESRCKRDELKDFEPLRNAAMGT